ncbi:MAG: hypothetical protein J6C44_10565 [Muribaculaceae bacterium]|nr:hypothetical protein [Muribaculaceae bacterium]
MKKIYLTLLACLMSISAMAWPDVYLLGDMTEWGENATYKFSSTDGITYTLKLSSLEAGKAFKIHYYENDQDHWCAPTPTGTLANYVSFTDDGLNNYCLASGNYTDLTLTYNRTEDKLNIDGSKATVKHNITITGDNWSWGNGDSFEYDADNNIYTITFESFDTNDFKLKKDGIFIENLNLSDEAKKYFQASGNNWKAINALQNVTLKYNADTNTLDTSFKQDTEGWYPFGNKISLWMRNDADTNQPFEEVKFEFDKWDEKTNPEGLNLFIASFRANARDIDFYTKNDAGVIFDNNTEYPLYKFDNFITEGKDQQGYWNKFTGLTLGEKYRVIIKAYHEGDAEHSFIGIFPENTNYPWGQHENGLRIHSNLNNGAWVGVEGNKAGLNISLGPQLTYDPNTDIWYYDFTAGPASALNRDANQKGWEFTFTDLYGIQWYKKDLELPYGVWTDNALYIQTEDNDRNFYILENTLENGIEYRLQLREKPGEPGQWQMRLIRKPDFSGSLYIAPEGSDYNNAVEMQKAMDVNGNVIEGLYIHSMYYPTDGFRVSTQTGDQFATNLLSKYTDNTSDLSKIALPYNYYEGETSDNTQPWKAEENTEFVTVLVNRNTGDLTILYPSITVELTNRHVAKMSGRHNAESLGVDKNLLYNKVYGSTENNPITFSRINNISADINITHRYFDSECVLTINSATINNLPVSGMSGLSAKDGKDLLVHHLTNIPYIGHLNLDGIETVHDKYVVTVNYTINKGELTTGEKSATFEYEPNFQPYFVRPNPITDADQSMRMKIGYSADQGYKALIMRTVKFHGYIFDNEGNAINHDYTGEGDVDDAKIAVYPGFNVSVKDETGNEVPQPLYHHIPIPESWGGDFCLTGFEPAWFNDWSERALVLGKLPVYVHTAQKTSARPEYEYTIYAHYPVYSVGGGQRVASTPETARVAARENTDVTPVVHNIVVRRVFSGEPELESEVTSVNQILGDNDTDAPVFFFDLQGRAVDADNLTPGLYIRRQGSQASKVLVR